MKKSIHIDEDAHLYRPFNMDTGKEIENCFSADDETGEYWQYVLDDNGNEKIQDGELVTIKKMGNIKLVHIYDIESASWVTQYLPV